MTRHRELALVTAILVSAVPSRAQWTTNGIPLCSAEGQQKAQAIAPDGSGGAIIVWQDNRSGNDFDLYVQRLDPAGNSLWGFDGAVVCNAIGEQVNPVILGDGNGGAFIAWEDGASGAINILAQRVDASGTLVWNAGGIPICTATGDQIDPGIVADGAGGLVLVWEDQRLANRKIYAQRVDDAGNRLWTTNGVAICGASGDQIRPVVVSDDALGAIIAWEDMRNGPGGDIFVQRVDAGGNTLWTTDGVPLCTVPEPSGLAAVAGDGHSGAIVAWVDVRNGQKIYAQRIDDGGIPAWDPDGIRVSTSLSDQAYPAIISDGAGGAIITWEDFIDPYSGIYAQRLGANGYKMWNPGGVALCTDHAMFFTGESPQFSRDIIISDGAGGAIIAWRDLREMYPSATYSAIYAQRIGPTGSPFWPQNGIALCNGGDSRYATVCSDGAGGAVVAWFDVFDPQGHSVFDVYAQRVDASGTAFSFTVTKTADDNTVGTLRVAIQQANALPGKQPIRFNIPGSGLQTIAPVSPLPAVTDSVIIDGFTQPGASPNTAAMGDPVNAVYQVQLDGATAVLGNGLVIQAPATVRGLTIKEFGWGVVVQSSGVVIEGNYIFSCVNDGILVTTSNGCRIGGDAAAARNIISANQSGIRLTDGVDNTGIYGNYIGVGVDGVTAVGNTHAGIHVGDNVSHAWIGTSALVVNPAPKEANIIANNGEFGIVVADPSSDKIVMAGNSIHDNGTLGIDLAADGPTANDPGDADGGPNHLQNHPVITSAGIDITGEMNGEPGKGMYLHFYRSSQCIGPAGKGDAAVLLGGMMVETDGAGHAPFTFVPSAPLPGGCYITATATSTGLETSEISPCVLYQNTLPGDGVTVNLVDQEGTLRGTATFQSVGGAGNTTFETPFTPAVPLSGGFYAGNPNDPAIYFDISTTAPYTGNVEVCITYDENNIPGAESALQLVHYTGAQWLAVTTSLDVVNNTICGTVPSLSPFVLAVSTAVPVLDKPLPAAFALHGNVPNPFNPATTIAYDVPGNGADVNIAIFDVSGRLVRELVNAHRAAGTWTVQWDGEDGHGTRVSSGVYFYRMRAGEFVETRKMVLLK